MSEPTLDQFLKPLSERLGRVAPPDAVEPCDYAATYPARVTDGLSHEELVEKFVEEAGKVRVQVRRCAEADLAKTVCGIVNEMGAGSVVYANDGLIVESGIPVALVDCPKATMTRRWSASQGRTAMIEACKVARYGITHASAGIAESATVVQVNDTNCGRSVSLLPLVHIAILRAEDIVPTLREALLSVREAGGADASGLPSQVCMISGPSMTSDIELVRVEGVHGPMYVYYVVVE